MNAAFETGIYVDCMFCKYLNLNILSFFFFFFDVLIDVRERGGEGERDRDMDIREKHRSVASCTCLDRGPNLGMCPDGESNPQSFGLQANTNQLNHTGQG